MKFNQKKLNTTELLIVFVVIEILLVVGLIVYNKKLEISSIERANQIAIKLEQKRIAESATKTKTIVTTENETDSERQYLDVKEWGVRIALNDEIRDLTYEIVGKGLNLYDKDQLVIKFYTKRLKAAQGVCSENNFPITLNRGLDVDIPIMGDGPAPEDSPSNSYGQLYLTDKIKPYKDDGMIQVGLIKIGDYYYTDAVYPGAVCDNYEDEIAERARQAEPIYAITKALISMQEYDEADF